MQFKGFWCEIRRISFNWVVVSALHFCYDLFVVIQVLNLGRVIILNHNSWFCFLFLFRFLLQLLFENNPRISRSWSINLFRLMVRSMLVLYCSCYFLVGGWNIHVSLGGCDLLVENNPVALSGEVLAVASIVFLSLQDRMVLHVKRSGPLMVGSGEVKLFKVPDR